MRDRFRSPHHLALLPPSLAFADAAAERHVALGSPPEEVHILAPNALVHYLADLPSADENVLP